MNTNQHERGPFGHYTRGGMGHILNNLVHFGVPLSVAESVTVGDGEIKLKDKSFALYKYFDGIDQPLFKFNDPAYQNRVNPANGNYQLTMGSHMSPALVLTGEFNASYLAWETVKRCMTNYTPDPFYKLSQDSGAFFQGGSNNQGGEYIYVEFWKPAGAQAWVDAFSQELKKRREEEGTR